MPTPATVLKPRGNVATRPKKPPSSFAKLGVPLAILGFCVQDNFDRAIGSMSRADDPIRRLVERLLAVPLV